MPPILKVNIKHSKYIMPVIATSHRSGSHMGTRTKIKVYWKIQIGSLY